MIVKMKKIHLVTQTADIPSTLEALRNLGVVHIEHQEELAGYQIAERREEVRVLIQVIEILEKTGTPSAAQSLTEDWTEVANAVLKDVAEIEQLKDAMVRRQNLITQWEPWGHFQPRDIQELAARGLQVTLHEIRTKDLDQVPSGVMVEMMAVSRGVARCVLVAREKTALPFSALDLPTEGLHQMKEALTVDAALIERLEKKVSDQSQYLESLRTIRVERQNVLEFEEAERGMSGQGPLAVLRGFCPVDAIDTLRTTASRERWALLVEEVAPEDTVPTCLRNPRWVELIRPVFQLIDIMPGYREVDVSLVFLVFFSIFFGILVGDAAYGVIYLIINAVLHMKLGKTIRNHSVFHLMYILSGCTILWGLMTGVVFGDRLLPAFNLGPLVPWLSDMNNMIFLCFVIAATHLSIAHIWRMILKFPSIILVAEAGWLILIWTMFFLANMFVLNKPFPSFGMNMLYSGMFLVVFFTSPHKNPLRSIGPGLGALAMNLINAFTDIVSYIRLFAVGLASLAVANAFNEMSFGIGFGNPISGFFAVLILILGHGLGLILAGLSVLVHGVRLNVLEFSGHLGMEWGGVKYKPFQKINVN